MLTEQLSADLKQAMLNRDQVAVSVLRMLQAEIKNAAIAKMGELTSDEELAVLRKEVKKRAEAATAYTSAGNTERAQAEEGEATILSKYLPAATNEDDVRAFLKEQASTLGDLEPRHKGELIRAAREKFGSALDGAVAARLVGELY